MTYSDLEMYEDENVIEADRQLELAYEFGDEVDVALAKDNLKNAIFSGPNAPF